MPIEYTEINVVGKRWLQRTYGNTYHSVKIYVSHPLPGQPDFYEVLYNPFQYGYDNMYRQTAHKMLLDAGFAVPENYHAFIYDDRVTFEVYDVQRKKDL